MAQKRRLSPIIGPCRSLLGDAMADGSPARSTLGVAVGSGEPTTGRSPFDTPKDADDGWVWCRARDRDEMHRMYAQIVHYIRDVQIGTVDNVAGQDDPTRVLSDVLEQCPTQEENPEYYEKVSASADQIARPTSLHAITHRIVHCEYAMPALFEQDMLQLFYNARTWYGLGTDGYREMVTLQRLFQQLTPSRTMMTDAGGTRHVKPRKDDVDLVEVRRAAAVATYHFASEKYGPGREPPADASVVSPHLLSVAWYKGRPYRVGDWVHLMNPVDPSRPIVAQLFRLYQRTDRPGVFVSACWYYRPEQTFHADTRLFAENEVVKTGVFGEHALEDVVEDVLVLYHTAYRTIRPTAEYSAPDAPVYVVEFKYDVVRREFHRIVSWPSCVPNEVRTKKTPVDELETSGVPLERGASPLLRGLRGPGFGSLIEAKRTDEPTEYRDLFATAHRVASPVIGRAEAAPLRQPTASLPASHPDRLRAYASFHVIASDVARRMSPASYAALQQALQQQPDLSAADLGRLETMYGAPVSLVARLRDAARSAGVLDNAAQVDVPPALGLAPVLAAHHTDAVFARLPPATGTFQARLPSFAVSKRRRRARPLVWGAAVGRVAHRGVDSGRDDAHPVTQPVLFVRLCHETAYALAARRFALFGGAVHRVKERVRLRLLGGQPFLVVVAE